MCSCGAVVRRLRRCFRSADANSAALCYYDSTHPSRRPSVVLVSRRRQNSSRLASTYTASFRLPNCGLPAFSSVMKPLGSRNRVVEPLLTLAATQSLPRPDFAKRNSPRSSHKLAFLVREALTDCIHEQTPSGSFPFPRKQRRAIFGRRTKNRAPLKLRP